MQKFILLIILLLFSTIAALAQAPFTQGNVVIYRVGAVGNPGLSSAATEVYLDEYTPTGVLVQSILMPTSPGAAGNPSNNMLTASGISVLEGMINLSVDGRYLLLTGYNAVVGTGGVGTSLAATNVRVIGVVDGNGIINTTTAWTNWANGGSPKAAISTNGTDLWGASAGTGTSIGIWYATLGTTTSVRVSAVNARSIKIANGQLYISTATVIQRVGTGLPTTIVATTTLPGYPSGSPYQYVFADMDAGVAGVDVLYVADDNASTGGIKKFSLVSGSWVSNGTVGVATDAYRGLTAIISGTSAQLFAVRNGGSGSTGGGELVTLTDATGYNATITGTPTLLATASANTAFRGIALAPSSSTNYFRSKQDGNWSDINTWEQSADNSSWANAVDIPNKNAQNIIIRNHTVTLTYPATIDKTIVNPTGTLIVNSNLTVENNGLTLQSDATGTARVGTSTGTITGNVKVERYIANPGHRAWHLLSVPATGTQTIYNAWQEAGVNNAGYGTLITSNLYNGSNGFDATSNTASILTHNQGGVSGPSWNYGLANTNTTQLASNPGYMLFVRGDRSYNAGNAPSTSPTTLRTTGGLRQGTQSAITVSSTGTGYTLVGNPYACPIDFESIYTTPNLDQNFYVWDPTLTGNYGLGGYRLVERTGGGTYQQTPVVLGGGPTGDPTSRYIHSGQAFFLKATGADASVIFTEASKANSVSVVNPVVNGPNDQQLIANLMIVNAGNVESLADGIRIRYDTAYQAGTGDDVLKMDNFGENLASYREGKSLIAESRPMIGTGDTIFLRITNTGIKDYRLQIGTLNFTQTTLLAYLQDRHLATNTLLNLTGGITYKDFSVTADPASAASDRFRIVFTANRPLPVSFTSIKAYQTAGSAGQTSNIKVEWKVSNQVNIQKYEVERSADGLIFNKLSTQNVIGNNGSDVAYTWTDLNPLQGDNYYRIKSTGAGNEIKYSLVAHVKINNGKPAITVSPNPIENNLIALRFTDMEKGVYSIRLINNAGQVLYSGTLSHAGGSAYQSLEIGRSVARGNYHLEIVHPDKNKTVKSVVITD